MQLQTQNLGQLSVGPDEYGRIVPQGGYPPAENADGAIIIIVNPPPGWNNLAAVKALNIATNMQTTYNYLTYLNQVLGANMSPLQADTLILLHEFEHTPLGGNASANHRGNPTGYNKAIYAKCIK